MIKMTNVRATKNVLSLKLKIYLVAHMSRIRPYSFSVGANLIYSADSQFRSKSLLFLPLCSACRRATVNERTLFFVRIRRGEREAEGEGGGEAASPSRRRFARPAVALLYLLLVLWSDGVVVRRRRLLRSFVGMAEPNKSPGAPTSVRP